MEQLALQYERWVPKLQLTCCVLQGQPQRYFQGVCILFLDIYILKNFI